MKLYYSPGACSLSPHIVLCEAERRFDLERVDLSTHLTSSGADYMRINPKGYVPALELDGPGSPILTEGPAIVQYIADLVPEKGLAPPNGTFLRYHLQEWLNFITAELHKQFSILFKRDAPESYRAVVRGKIGDRLEYIQERLSDRGYLLGETFSVADAYLFVMLQWAPRFGIDPLIWPNVADYEFRIARRPAVRAAMAAEGLESPHHLEGAA